MTTPEFSRLVQVDGLTRPRSRHHVKATSDERAALAKRFGLLALDELSAELMVEFMTGEREMSVTGRLTAAVTQACVISLEPVTERIDEQVRVDFSRDVTDDPDHDLSIGGGELGVGGAVLHEPWPGQSLDLGELAAQELALSLNPYPRAKGARLPDPGSMADNPFAALRARPGKGRA